jgi:hypothetical protein
MPWRASDESEALVIDGNRVFIIENCVYNQIGDLVVKGNATLIIDNAELFINQTAPYEYSITVADNARVFVSNAHIFSNHCFSQSFEGQSAVYLVNSRVDVFWTYAHGKSFFVYNTTLVDLWVTTSMTFSDSSAELVLTDPGADVTIENSSMSKVSIGAYSSRIIANDLLGGPVTTFNTFNNLTVEGGSVANLTVRNSKLDLHFDISNTDLTLNNCSISGVEAEHSFEIGSNMAIQDSTLRWGIHVRGMSNAVIRNSAVGYLLCGYGHPTLKVYDSRITTLALENTSSTTISLSNVTLSEPVGLANATIIREYNTYVMNSTGQPLINSELKLIDKNENFVWTGYTDDTGKAAFNVTFVDGNYTDHLKLTAKLAGENGTYVADIVFFTNMPITIPEYNSLQITAFFALVTLLSVMLLKGKTTGARCSRTGRLLSASETRRS